MKKPLIYFSLCLLAIQYASCVDVKAYQKCISTTARWSWRPKNVKCLKPILKPTGKGLPELMAEKWEAVVGVINKINRLTMNCSSTTETQGKTENY